MRILIAALLVVPLSVFAFLASAEEPERYRLERTDNGYVRMDAETGAMSICEERSGQLVCRMAADERAAFQDEIDRLGDSLRALENRVTALEKAPALPGLPTDEEFDKTMSYMERFFRGFMDIVREFQNDDKTDADPQRT